MVNMKLREEIWRITNTGKGLKFHPYWRHILLNNKEIAIVTVEKPPFQNVKRIEFLIVQQTNDFLEECLKEKSIGEKRIGEDALQFLKASHQLYFMCIFYFNKPTKFISLPRLDRTEIQSLLKYNEVRCETTYQSVRKEGNSITDWNNLKIYEELDIVPVYEQIRQGIARYLALYAPIFKEKEIVVIDIGTGTGKSLATVVQHLPATTRVARAIGMDLNEENIQQAKTELKNYEFYVVNSLLLGAKLKNLGLKPEHKIVFVSSGGVHRQVLNSTVQAMYILQQALRYGVVLWVLSGYSSALLPERVIKRVGWMVKTNHYSDTSKNVLRPVNILTTIQFADLPQCAGLPQYKNFGKKVFKVKEQALDLRFHGHPLSVLKTFSAEQLATITTLDLTLAYVENAEEELSQLVELCPQLQKIYISGIEPWLNCLKILVTNLGKPIEIIEERWRHLFSKKNAEFSQQDLKSRVDDSVQENTVYSNNSKEFKSIEKQQQSTSPSHVICINEEKKYEEEDRISPTQEKLLREIEELEIKPFSPKFYKNLEKSVNKMDIQRLAMETEQKINQSEPYRLEISQHASEQSPDTEEESIETFLLTLMKMGFQENDLSALYIPHTLQNANLFRV